MEKKAVAILVGGGPAPGINGVISAATIEAINRGHKVYGVRNGFELLSKGDKNCARELLIQDVSRIHTEGGSILGTSRANPTKSPEMLKNVVETLKVLNVGYLVTIGGDDTATSAKAVAEAAGRAISVGHVPKTIDNDLPLPEKYSTFGFESAREVGTQITGTLMVDAKTTGRWYFVVAMGRKAGHLALGIGVSSGATLTLIPEEFGLGNIKLPYLVNTIAGSILKRAAMDLPYGVVVLAEGLAEKMDVSSIPELANAERDPHGHIRYAEIDFGGIVKRAVQARLKELKVKTTVVEKNVGYELRCGSPNSFDREYTRLLGYGIVEYLINGGTDGMITRQRDSLVPIPFSQMIDPESGKTKVRYVELDSVVYQVARKYMIRLEHDDFQNADLVRRLTELTGLSKEQLVNQFHDSLAAIDGYPERIEKGLQ
jgi:ATP-dependent phosphofructokinase / diphosphate-dependent phosphofructokinase